MQVNNPETSSHAFLFRGVEVPVKDRKQVESRFTEGEPLSFQTPVLSFLSRSKIYTCLYYFEFGDPWLQPPVRPVMEAFPDVRLVPQLQVPGLQLRPQPLLSLVYAQCRQHAHHCLPIDTTRGYSRMSGSTLNDLTLWKMLSLRFIHLDTGTGLIHFFHLFSPADI